MYVECVYCQRVCGHRVLKSVTTVRRSAAVSILTLISNQRIYLYIYILKDVSPYRIVVERIKKRVHAERHVLLHWLTFRSTPLHKQQSNKVVDARTVNVYFAIVVTKTYTAITVWPKYVGLMSVLTSSVYIESSNWNLHIYLHLTSWAPWDERSINTDFKVPAWWWLYRS